MDSTVATFNCEYRAVGDATAPGPVELELDLRSHFARGLDDGIGLALGGDPAVYAIRRLDCEVTLRADGRGAPDLARRMAGAVTNAILRALSNHDRRIPGLAGPGIEDDVAEFADEAEFLARFVIDLLEDRAHGRWYYACFGDALASSRGEALASVLSGPGMGPAGVSVRALGRIFARGYLERLLGELPAAAAASLAMVAPDSALADDGFRPLLNAALMLVDGFAAPPHSREQLLRDFAATHPAPRDWRDRSSLADGVLDALRFLLRRQPARSGPQRVSAPITAAVAKLDWLDQPRLVDGIERLLASDAGPVDAGASVRARPPVPARLSARQRLILRDLAAACRSGWPGVEAWRGDCPANRLRLLAALTAQGEQWADDPVAVALVAAVLRELARGAGTERRLLRELAALGVGEAEAEVGSGRLKPARAAADRATADRAVGDRAVADRAVADRATGTYSDAAGVALLVRAALDLRVAGLASAAGFMSGPEAVAASLNALAAGGCAGHDPALDLIAPAPVALPGPSADDTARREFESKLAGALAARGLLEGEPSLAAIEIGGVSALVGGIERPAVWPLTQLVSGDPDEIGATVARWRREWARAVGGAEPAFSAVSEDQALTGTLDALLDRSEPISPAQLTLIATGLTLVRAWGRWLPGLGRSSLSYLLAHFIRRSGTIRRDGAEVSVRLDRGDLDAVLELSGALAPIDARRPLGVVIRFELVP